MSAMRTPARVTAAASFAVLALAASACGSDSSTETTAAPAGSEAEAEHQEPDLPELATNDDVRLIELLDVATGEPTTIADTVTGDRPVLLWFWAPH